MLDLGLSKMALIGVVALAFWVVIIAVFTPLFAATTM